MVILELLMLCVDAATANVCARQNNISIIATHTCPEFLSVGALLHTGGMGSVCFLFVGLGVGEEIQLIGTDYARPNSNTEINSSVVPVSGPFFFWLPSGAGGQTGGRRPPRPHLPTRNQVAKKSRGRVQKVADPGKAWKGDEASPVYRRAT